MSFTIGDWEIGKGVYQWYATRSDGVLVTADSYAHLLIMIDQTDNPEACE